MSCQAALRWDTIKVFEGPHREARKLHAGPLALPICLLVFKLRSATGPDAEAIIRIHFAAVHETASPYYPPDVVSAWSKPPCEDRYERVRQSIAKGDEMFVVAERESVIVGFGSIVPREHELRSVYVHPDLGRRGVGAMILERLERMAMEQRVVTLELDGSINAEAFYRRHGYVVIEHCVRPIGGTHTMACVRMRKVLTSV